MHYAIQLQKISLGEDRVLFRPTNLIKGTFLEDEEIFIDERDFEYWLMKDNSGDYEHYFCCPRTLEELRESYDVEPTEKEILDHFLSEFLDVFFVGYYDYSEGLTRAVRFDLEEIEKDLEIALKNLGTTEPEEKEEIPKVLLSLQDLERLKECDTLEGMKSFIDKLIDVGKSIENDIAEEKNISKDNLQPETEEIKKEKLSLKKEESSKFNLGKLRKKVLATIVDQDEAVYDLTRAIAVNQTSNDFRNKSHILISGPSGTGKTELVRTVANEIDIPLFVVNCPDYTKAGYYGKDVHSILLGLINAAGGDQEKAEHGIIILDEIDKLVTFQGDKGFGKAVLHELLKILDRDIIEIDVEKGRKDTILFDTSNITAICMGSFEELYEQKKCDKKKSIGFINTNDEKEQKVRLDEDDFIKWMGPEFVGRIGIFTETEELTQKSVLRILKQSKISQLKIATEDFAERGIKLLVTNGYLEAVAKKGYSKKLGVRKLNKEVKKTLKYAYDEILENPKVKSIKLTKKTVENNKEYCVEY